MPALRSRMGLRGAIVPRRIGHWVTRPGRGPDEPPITFPVAKDLESVPGIPSRDGEVSFYSREFPLESVAIEQSASAEWARDVREDFSPETARLYERHQQDMLPVVDWLKSSGDLQPEGEPTGEDVSEIIRTRARELGYGEGGVHALRPSVRISVEAELCPRRPASCHLPRPRAGLHRYPDAPQPGGRNRPRRRPQAPGRDGPPASRLHRLSGLPMPGVGTDNGIPAR